MKSNRMPLAPAALGLAAGMVAAILFTFCALTGVFAPDVANAALARALHPDHALLARPFSAGAFIQGLLCASVGTGLSFAAVGALYNGLLPPPPGGALGAGHDGDVP